MAESKIKDSKSKTTMTSLASAYPVNTLVELKLSHPAGTTVRGLIYCTDEVSQSIVLKKALVHTTLSSEVTVINASSVLESRSLMGANGGKDNDKNGGSKEEEGNLAKELAGVNSLEELKLLPLPNVSRKVLEERERRAIRLAEESFGHINQKATPEGQKTFDKLLKACNDVTWKGTSIIVLKEIRVDPPYSPDDCTLIRAQNSGLDAHSLDRVKKIVTASKQS